jgi:hypothetical protein
MAHLTRNDKLALTEWLEERLEAINRVADGIPTLSKDLEKTQSVIAITLAATKSRLAAPDDDGAIDHRIVADGARGHVGEGQLRHS